MKVRIFKRLDGNIDIFTSAIKSKRPTESEEEWYERVCAKANPLGLPYVDIDETELPSREYRNAWEWDDVTKKIKVNATKATAIRSKMERESKIRVEVKRLAEQSLIDKGEI